MRIVAGEFKGRRIRVVRGNALRPTTEKVRAAIFSALASLVDLDGLHILDLFAGSGALGIEALSRGALQATFVEFDRANAQCLRQTLADLELSERTCVLSADVYAVLKRGSSSLRTSTHPAVFDLIFADPPYQEFAAAPFFKLLTGSGLIRKDSILVLEIVNEMNILKEIEAVEGSLCPRIVKDKNYGDTRVSFIRFD